MSLILLAHYKYRSVMLFLKAVRSLITHYLFPDTL
jgi:hypothetical protein